MEAVKNDIRAIGLLQKIDPEVMEYVYTEILKIKLSVQTKKHIEEEQRGE